MSPTAPSEVSGSRALDRGLSILHLFTEGTPELTVRDICKRLSIPHATAYRLVNTLTTHGYLRPVRSSTGKFELGLEILRLASSATAGSDLQAVTVPILNELVEVTAETCVLLVPGMTSAVCVRVVEGTSPIRPRSARVGEHIPYNGGASPMAIFAFLPPEERARIIALGMSAYASQTPVTPEEIERSCSAIRELGYAYSTNEYIEGTSAYAAPIFDVDGTVIAAIGITGVSDNVVGFDGLILNAAAEATLKIGGRIPAIRERSALVGVGSR